MNQNTTHELIRHLPLGMSDIARLILELAENLGISEKKLTRDEMIVCLRRAILAGTEAIRQAEKSVPFAEAAAASLQARQNRRPTTLRDLRHFIGRMLRDSQAARRPLRTWTVQDCRTLLQNCFSNSVNSYRKGRAILSSIFSYGLRQGWCSFNPVQGVENPPVEEKIIEPLNMEEVRRLEGAAAKPRHRCMQLSLKLMLYCGVRPTEITRINPERDIIDDMLIIRPQCSKTGGGRIIPLRKVADFLKRHSERKMIPANWQQKWKALRQAADFRQWKPDICRHTFATYHARHFKNLSILQMEMGHRSPALLQTRYISAVPLPHAADFWR